MNRTILTLAGRELRGGLRGFGVFLACIALGVAAIAGVGSFARALVDGVGREGRSILGGDLAVSLIHREATPEELAALAREGRVSQIATMRAIARTPDGRTALVEIKAVDGAYPLVGQVVATPAGPLAALLAPEAGTHRALAEPGLIGRLDLKPGDRLTIGNAAVAIAGTLQGEPDKLAGGIGFGPRLMMSLDALRATGLIQPGSLVRWHYRVDAGPGRSEADLEAAAKRIEQAAPLAGWEIRTRTNASPQIERNVSRFTQFLALVGFTALLVGGVGVANAVAAHMDRKRDDIATLKAIGATGGTVVRIYLAQILMLAGLGTAIGAVVGAVLPSLVGAMIGDLLPLPIAAGIYPRELGLAIVYGLLVALAFALWPLGRAHDVPVSALYRDHVAGGTRRIRLRYVVAAGAAILALLLLSASAAFDARIVWIYAAAAAGSFVALRLVAAAIMAIARRLPRPSATAPRLALGNLHRPGAMTPSVVLALGLGLTLLSALVQIDGNLSRQLTAAVPARAPSFFFVDIQNAEADAFRDFVTKRAPGAQYQSVPMLRGRITAMRGVEAGRLTAADNAMWVLQGDRGITYAAEPPPGSVMMEGAWWPKDYAGKPLVSFEDRLAKAFGLKIGDTIEVNVLGRTITATIANLRRVEWESFGINFVLVFSPNTFAGAPHTHLATLTYPKGAEVRDEIALAKAAAETYPTVTTVRVKDALDAINKVVTDLATAIRAASSVALIASIIVLAGALAAGHRHRIYDAVVLKTLGATRGRLVGAFALEYAMLGLVTAVFGVAAGSFAAYAVLTWVMKVGFSFEPGPAAATVLVAAIVTVALGLVGSWRVLGQRPAGVLRGA